MTLQPGTRLGPYEILAPLGAGGMGEVYRALDPRLGREVAIKVLPGTLTEDPERLERLQREAKTLAALSHPNLLAIHDFIRFEGAPCLVTELLRGRSLREALARGPLPWRQTAKLGSQAAEGLAAAHRAGIVHRDIKPDNLFLCEDGTLKILDFGLAKFHAPSGSEDETQALEASGSLTRTGVVMGSAAYMSPEQATGSALDARSDLFSLGATLWEALGGARPFQGATTVDVLHAIAREEPRPLPEGLDAPPGLEALLRHCLEKAPEQRFQSAADLAYSLQQAGGTTALRALPAAAPRPRLWIGAGLAAAGAAAAWFLRPAAPPAHPPRILTLTDGLHRVYAPALSPDGKWIAYLQDTDGHIDLWTKFVDGGAPINLTAKTGMVLNTDSLVGGLDIAPDGGSILVPAAGKGQAIQNAGIWSFPAPLGGQPRKVVEQGAGPRWSPDGRRICYMIGNPSGGDSILVADADGREVKVLVPPANGQHVHQPAWSADGRFIYYSFANAANTAPTAIHRVSADGASQPEIILPTAGVAMMAELSPDGASLLFAGTRGAEPLNLWRVPVGFKAAGPEWWSGSRGERLTTGMGEFVEPRLSKDGKRLLCTWRKPSWSILRFAADGLEQKEPLGSLTGLGSGDHFPAVCGVTGQVVFSSIRDGVSNIWTLLPGEREPRQLTMGAGSDRAPAISPDGTTVAFVSEREGARGIWTVPSVGGSPRLLRHAEVQDSLSFSPDGRRLVYAAGTDARNPGLWILSLQDGAARVIPGVVGKLPAWHPAKDLIAYARATYTAGSPRLISFTDPEGREALKDLSPEVLGPVGIAWSHDGTRLAFNMGIQRPDLLILDLRTGQAPRVALRSEAYWQMLGMAWSRDDRELLVGQERADSQLLLLDWSR